MSFNLLEKIMETANQNNTQITHILSYDLISKEKSFYQEFDELIREEFP
jgi:hypothetical protein